MLKFLCTNKVVQKITMETCLENNSDITIVTVTSTLEEIQLNANHDISTSKSLSITEV